MSAENCLHCKSSSCVELIISTAKLERAALVDFTTAESTPISGIQSANLHVQTQAWYRSSVINKRVQDHFEQKRIAMSVDFTL